MFTEKNDLICAAFVAARKELKNPERSAVANRSKYAKLEQVTALVNPILTEFDLTFTQTVRATAKTIRVRTTLIHTSGQCMWTDSAPMPLGPNSTTHTVAGATTYARRYGLVTLLGIEQDDDDDGKASMEAFIEAKDPDCESGDEPKDQTPPPNLIAEQATPKHPDATAIKALKEKVSEGTWSYEQAVARVEKEGLALTPKQTKDLRAAKPKEVSA